MTSRRVRGRSLGWRGAAAAALPVAVPPAMTLLFHRLSRRYGNTRGYRAGMIAYWMLCAGLPLAIAGPRRLSRLLDAPRGPLPQPRWLAMAALVVPPAGAIATELVPQLRHTTGRGVATAVAVGVTNAMAEELLWRALPVAMFPADPVRGWIASAAGFTLWHLAPLSVRPHLRGPVPHPRRRRDDRRRRRLDRLVHPIAAPGAAPARGHRRVRTARRTQHLDPHLTYRGPSMPATGRRIVGAAGCWGSNRHGCRTQ